MSKFRRKTIKLKILYKNTTKKLARKQTKIMIPTNQKSHINIITLPIMPHLGQLGYTLMTSASRCLALSSQVSLPSFCVLLLSALPLRLRTSSL